MSRRSIYRGPRRKLVLAFDVGTAYSGISYSVLDPGQVPEIKGVTRFPANEHVTGGSKIPTVIYYDRSGKVRAVGAEAMKEGIFEVAEDENWVKAEWFKLHLSAGRSVGTLPLNKTVTEVFGDFLRYFLECASSYIQDTHANGPDLWNSVKSHIDFVLSHPNGWKSAERIKMRRAALLAGLIPDNMSGHSRLSFVTEGEASLRFSVQNGLPAGAMKNGDRVVIVDAGGGTIYISSYSTGIFQKDNLEEIAAPQSHFHGSVFVTCHARRFLERYLTDSPFLDDLEHIVRSFDKTTKLRFRKVEEPQYVKFGSTRDNDEIYNIRFGQLKLMGSDVAQFFQPSIDCIVKAVLELESSTNKIISHVVLVGGFAASDWLFTKVYETLTPLGMNIVRPGNYANKAVSDGSISFYLAPGRLLEDEQQDRILATKQSTHVPAYGQGFIIPTGRPPAVSPNDEYRDKYKLLKKEYDRTRDKYQLQMEEHSRTRQIPAPDGRALSNPRQISAPGGRALSNPRQISAPGGRALSNPRRVETNPRHVELCR